MSMMLDFSGDSRRRSDPELYRMLYEELVSAGFYKRYAKRLADDSNYHVNYIAAIVRLARQQIAAIKRLEGVNDRKARQVFNLSLIHI